AVLDGVLEETVDERRAEAGELTAGVFRQGLGVEGDTEDFLAGNAHLLGGLGGGQQQVVDLRLDLRPGAAADLDVVTDERLERGARGRLFTAGSYHGFRTSPSRTTQAGLRALPPRARAFGLVPCCFSRRKSSRSS